MKRRTFLEGFGYSASPRVRQTSLSSAVENIQRWGYAHKLSGSTVNDYITIWKSDAPVSSEQPQRGWWPKWSVSGQRFRMFAEPFGPPSQRAARDGGGSARGVVAWKDGELDLPVDPLTFGFHVDDAPTGERSGALWHDITAAIWSCRTVCLMVDASDEMFTLLAGVLAALIRRRALTFRFDDMGRWVAQAPEVLTLSRVRSVTGQGDRRESDDFPDVGAVYLIRDDPHDVVDDELTAFVREALVPHTYRVRAIFTTTTADPGHHDAPRTATAAVWTSSVVYSYTVGCLPLGASSVQLYGRMPSAWCDVAVIAGVSRVEGLSDRIRPVLSISSYSRTARARNGSEDLDFAERVYLSCPPKRLTTLSGWARTESP
ncbi:hypothetical protein WME97_43325 [Sorangium sp. So ce367]|uniref:hypothetical protein n=1 Tax=Sorangium sp. So ce367 TaxID=3133305 RepID=UPI003F642B95